MPQKVLIVDDEPNIVTSLTFLMKKSGFETSVARDGDEALSEVERFGPDLVLLDVMMPNRDGFKPFSTRELVDLVNQLLAGG